MLHCFFLSLTLGGRGSPAEARDGCNAERGGATAVLHGHAVDLSQECVGSPRPHQGAGSAVGAYAQTRQPRVHTGVNR